MGQSNKTVLIVDKNPAMCYYHALLLMRLQYLAMTARTSAEALIRLRGSAPSLIITVVSSSASNGIDFIKTLKDNERTKAIPIIALVDDRDEKLMASCRASGCTACLVQPADPHQLFQTVQSVTETTPREHIRLNLALKAVLEDCGAFSKSDQVAYTSTISEGGFSVRTHATPPKHSLTPVRISVQDREIRARAEVLYHMTPDPRKYQEPGMGLKFIDIAEDDRIFLRGFIKEQLVHDIFPGNRPSA
jgi:CheY-like chemotaxis protein